MRWTFDETALLIERDCEEAGVDRKRRLLVGLATLLALTVAAGSFLVHRYYFAHARFDLAAEPAPRTAPPSLAPELARLGERRGPALKRYFVEHSIPPTESPRAFLDVVGDPWGTESIPEPPVKKRLLRIAARALLEPKDCVWLRYDTGEGEVSWLLAYSAKSDQWRPLARRLWNGDGEHWSGD